MSRIVYLNGQWLPEDEAKVSIFDRGYTFADAIYEVTAVIGGKLLDYPGHVTRLKRSLEAIGIPMPVGENELLDLHHEIVAKNGVDEGLIYLQVSRGAEDRNFLYSEDLKPTFSMFTQAFPVLANPKVESGITVVSMPDGRWVNRQIKTVQLLYSSLAKMEAKKQGADDVIFVEDGFITEASSANFHIITRAGVLVTRHLSNALLHGITRGSVLGLAGKADLQFEERAFSVEEALDAAEAFVTSATNFVMPVVSIDGKAIGSGRPGASTLKLREIYIADKLAHAIGR
ncbi:D-alanine transaminase [Neorhizobium huautlense]|uniref:Probable branched-chain-amino-acid aminotransferase n=1 Tax=Neorhizobium huautlense TaxID=67774 RepID=A0ABT9PN86_9HYPH|nr:D-amino-acid transaminase [Neorhizobium huautlense]MDP9835900.1 D-alanine transaminase [Neorhizobium huautlense]